MTARRDGGLRPALDERIRELAAALEDPAAGPLVVTGGPGAGRTAALDRLAELADPGRFRVVRWEARYGAVEALARLTELRQAHRKGAESRRPLLVLDDAHLAGHAVVRALREAHRRFGAVVVVSRQDGAPEGALDCLRYEPGARSVALRPLTAQETGAVAGALAGQEPDAAVAGALHAASGGNPGLLGELVGHALALGALGGPAVPPRGPGPGERGAAALRAALEEAWRVLDLERADVLSTLALGLADGGRAASVRAFLLLLRGRAEEGLLLLDGPEHARSADTVLLRALLLGLGLGRTAEADGLLLRESAADPRHGPRHRAHRAWLLTVTGRHGDAREALSAFAAEGDREASLFARAALAGVALGDNRPAEAVPRLRRALVEAPCLEARLPWLSRWLTASLVDALLLSGRITEATALAGEFHAADRGAGREVVAALTSLTASPRPHPQPAA